jgi:hypothetical protein
LNADRAPQLKARVGQLLMKVMLLPPELANEIQARLDRAKKGSGSLSTDRSAVLVDGSIGYGCYVSPAGDVFLETYHVGSDEPPNVDRSRHAQLVVLLLGSRTLLQLTELLPKRPSGVPNCSGCNGTRWTHQEIFRQFGGDGIVCQKCSGLGWVEISS